MVAPQADAPPVVVMVNGLADLLPDSYSENDMPIDIKEFFAWFRQSCDILWVYIYLKVGMTHFYRLALYNLVLGLTDILLKSKLFK